MSKPLDSMPYRCSESNTGRDKYSAGHNEFAPRPEYEQDRSKY